MGTHFNLVEFMERNRAGMASTFVTRLKVGESLVDAKGVSRLVSPRIGIWPLVAFAAAGSAVVVAVLVSPALRNVIQSTRANARALEARSVETSRAGRRGRLDSSRVRPPLPRRIADRGLRGARDRHPRRRRPLRAGVRQRCRAEEPPGADRRPETASVTPRSARRPRQRGELALKDFADAAYRRSSRDRLDGQEGRGAVRRPGRPGRRVP